MIFCVSPNGNDDWSGASPEPTDGDGPVQSLGRARDLARRIRLENVPSGLSEPGTWWLDAAANRLYLWPRDGKRPDGIEPPVLTELIRVDGGDDVVRNITLDGLMFCRGERVVMRTDRVSLQHDWEWFDETNALLRLRGEGLQSAIRTDGWQWHTRIYENVVWRVDAGAFTVKQINDFDNNFMIDCRRHGCILARRSPGGAAWGCTVRRNIMYQPKAEIRDPKAFPPFYEECGEMRDGIHGKLAHLDIDDNLLYCAEDNQVAKDCLARMRKELDKDRRSLAADPCFVDPENGDFHLRPDSPARKLGIRPIETWGIRKRKNPNR